MERNLLAYARCSKVIGIHRPRLYTIFVGTDLSRPKWGLGEHVEEKERCRHVASPSGRDKSVPTIIHVTHHTRNNGPKSPIKWNAAQK